MHNKFKSKEITQIIMTYIVFLFNCFRIYEIGIHVRTSKIIINCNCVIKFLCVVVILK